MGRPRDADSSETIDRIIQAAAQVLEEQGTAKLSVRKVAQVAGLSGGSVSYYYASKEELIEACLDHVHDEQTVHVAEMTVALAAGEPFDKALEQVVRKLYRASVRYRTLTRLRMISVIENDSLPERRRRDVLEPALELGAKQLQDLSGASLTEARLTGMHLIYMVARFAAMAPSELMSLTACETAEDAVAAAEEHLVRVTRLLMLPVGPKA